MMIQIDGTPVVLRDMVPADIEDYVAWHTGDPQWARWDAPWEQLASPQEVREQKTRWLSRPLPVPRKRMEIQAGNDGHVGWVMSYRMKENKDKTCVGLVVAAAACWGKGIGTRALQGWLSYCFAGGVDELFCETWSGNARMIGLAEKCGFIESERQKDSVTVGSVSYDGLTFRLCHDAFAALRDAAIILVR